MNTSRDSKELAVVDSSMFVTHCRVEYEFFVGDDRLNPQPIVAVRDQQRTYAKCTTCQVETIVVKLVRHKTQKTTLL